MEYMLHRFVFHYHAKGERARRVSFSCFMASITRSRSWTRAW